MELSNMARKSQHFTKHTAGEIDQLFSRAIRPLGMRIGDEERNQRLGAIRMDGVPFSQRPRELRKPGSIYYAQGYLEARSVAGMLVDLGLSETAENVVRRDSPDIEVRFAKAPTLYVEQTMVRDEKATKWAVAIDDANITIERIASELSALDSLLKGGLLTIKMAQPSDERLESGISADALAHEVIKATRRINGSLWLEVSDANRFPLLLGATIVYKPGAARTARPLQLPMFHARPRLLEPCLHAVLINKRADASRYAKECRPLWLLVDIDKDFDAGGLVGPIVQRALGEVQMGVYDRVIIQQLGEPPIVSDVPRR